MKLNKMINLIDDNNTFNSVFKRVNEYKSINPDKQLLSLGVGDVSIPIIKPIIDEMKRAVDDLSCIDTFHGYDTTYGYTPLKELILKHEYNNIFTTDEIYISAGTKTDSTSILELFDISSKIGIYEPFYPVHINGAYALNRNIDILKTDDSFNLIIPDKKYDIIYICNPNNPTGISYEKNTLEKLIEYAIKNNTIILYDNVYYSFDNETSSIYDIKNAKKCVIEFRSFSKLISFSGVRCSYYIIPNEIDKDINKIWKKRTLNRFNGSDYIAQKGACAIYKEESLKLINENKLYYQENMKLLRECFISHGYEVHGGLSSPYMFIKCKNKDNSWEEFDYFLNNLNIIIIPGILFGNDSYFRVSALASRDTILKVIERMNSYEK